MQLTGKEIIKEGIITNYLVKSIQQQGVDVRLDKVYGRAEESGNVYKNKTEIPKRQEYPILNDNIYYLRPGYYEVYLMEGIQMTDDTALYFKTRSSLVRCGAIVHSGQFDAGFHTDKAGCFLHVIEPIYIEKGARIAQAIVHRSDKVENLYSGQFQNDKQRDHTK